MSDDLSVLFDRIRLLLHAKEGEPESGVDAVEHTLTDGYARALALEGERRRAEARIRELAGSAEHVDDLRALKERLDGIDEELSQLRELLGGLAATL